MDRQVLINSRAFGRRITGVERYTREVSARLDLPHRLVGASAWQGALGHLWEQTVLPGQVRKGETLWSPANTGPLAVSNQVLTIHDLSVIDHPEWFSPRFASWYGWFLPRLAHKVRTIVTDSLYSKVRIQQAFRISENKIQVAPCGVDREKFRPRTAAEQGRLRERYRLPPAYLLFVGSLEPRKNLKLLLRAWSRIEKQAAPLQLVVAGQPGRSFRSHPAGQTAPRGVMNIGYVDDADLPALYSAALGLILPSIYEGFGLPLLEAMACGTPVIAARAASLPEVVGEAGIFIDPRSEEEIASAILCLYQDERLRTKLARKGFRRAQHFSWDRTAHLVKRALEHAGE